eukprot:6973452-Ditylum_brightwellii.AAC.1
MVHHNKYKATRITVQVHIGRQEATSRASYCIEPNQGHCIDEIKQWPKRVILPTLKALNGGLIMIKGCGTVRWRFEDNASNIHTHDIKGTAYVPDAPYCILSPQHWAQQAQDNKLIPRGTMEEIYADCAILRWSQRCFQRTV